MCVLHECKQNWFDVSMPSDIKKMPAVVVIEKVEVAIGWMFTKPSKKRITVLG